MYDDDYDTQIKNLTNKAYVLNNEIADILHNIQQMATNLYYPTATEDEQNQYNKYFSDKEELERKITLINKKINLFKQAQQLQKNITIFLNTPRKSYSSEDKKNYSNMQTQLNTINGEIDRVRLMN